MNTETSKVMFALLRSAVCGGLLSGEEISLYSPDILPEITSLAQKHDVIHLIVFALKMNGLLDESNKNIESKMLIAVYRLEKLNYELTKLCAALEQAEIPFIPLKESVLRQYYPEPWMRTSCDIDVLVHKENLKRTISFLTELSILVIAMKRRALMTFRCSHKTEIILSCIMTFWEIM